MKNLKHIKKFIFDYAQYQIEDEKGNKALLRVNYKKNEYSLAGVGKIKHSDMAKEVKEVAQDLLDRKHGVNFAGK